MTHYVPYFTTARWPTAACGRSARFVTVEHSTEPTCPECKAWLEASADEIQQQLNADTAAQRAAGVTK